METILIVDDDPPIVETLGEMLTGEGYGVLSDATGARALEIIAREAVELILLDVNLGSVNGVELLAELKMRHPSINVIMISGESDIETAVKALRLGAFDFLEKPLRKGKLALAVRNALADRRQRSENERLRDSLLASWRFTGTSAAIIAVEDLVGRAASGSLSVLITGENGTGKEIAARRLHYQSKRVSGPFMALNCASIPRDLLESELFGHRRGAFTGATADRPGIFLAAAGGTLFMDEIGDMPLDLQAKLLRVLQEKEVTPLGSTAPISVDVRVIAATNRNLQELITARQFREDLYYRLNGLVINLPPLRERRGDIPLLAGEFAARYCCENNQPLPRIDAAALERLSAYDFPGNVRELKNIVERTLLLIDGEVIDDFTLPASPRVGTAPDGSLGSLAEVKHRLLHDYLAQRLVDLGGDKRALAGELCIHPNNLYRLMRGIGD